MTMEFKFPSEIHSFMLNFEIEKYEISIFRLKNFPKVKWNYKLDLKCEKNQHFLDGSGGKTNAQK